MRSIFSPLPKASLPIDAPPLALALLCVVTLSIASGRKTPVEPGAPLENAHAHNDYEHDRPFWDAYRVGFTSFEADIHLVGDALLVGHDPEDLRPDRTLEALYLEPMDELCARHGGYVYPAPTQVTLLIDIKTEAQSTYAALKPRLERFAARLTRYEDEAVVPGPIIAILSGNRPKEVLASETTRWAFHDGRLPDLDHGIDPQLTPLISDNWAHHFDWDATGPLSESEATKLSALVQKTHAAGARLRFWNLPDEPAAWEALRAAGVDWINTDRLDDLGQFLRSSLGAH